jgi:hypothetical protein
MRVPFARFALAGFFAAAAFAATPGFAGDQKVSKELAKPLTAAQQSMKANDFAGALVHMKEAQAVPNRTAFDDFTINEFLGNIYIGQKDYTNAAIAYEAMADSPALPPDRAKETLTNAVLLDSNANRNDKVIGYAEKLKAMGPLDPKVAVPLAVAYYNGGQTQKAQEIALAEQSAAQAAGRPVDQALLDIIARSQLKSNDVAGAAKTMEALVIANGDPNTWAQLIDIAFSTKGLNDIDALDLYRLRVATNATTSLDDYAIMAEITTKAGYPAETVAFLEHGQGQGVVKPGDKTGGLLSTARAKVAGDKASLPGFEAQAKARKTGDYDVKLAETFYGYGRYADAADAAGRALSKGGVKDPNEAPLVLGMSLAMQGKNPEAVDALSKVSGNGAAAKIAHLWTLYAQRKYGAAADAAAPAPAK